MLGNANSPRTSIGRKERKDRVRVKARMSDTQERKSTILKGMAGLPSFGDDRKGLAMTTTSSKFFDELAKLMSNAAGAAQGVRKEFDSMVRTQLERAMTGMDVVQREEFEAVKQMAAKAREENERLQQRIAELEARLAITAPPTN
jgi:BMFP domain-containing protein YqiC